MVIIDSFLPNPKGKDSAGEYVALFNNGGTQVNLSGWQLKNKSGKTAALDGLVIEPNQILNLPVSQTKLTLLNSGETVSLFDNTGSLIDSLSYTGAAAEGFIVRHGGALSTQTRSELFDPLASAALPDKIVPPISQQGVWIGLLFAVLLAGVAVFVYNKVQDAKPKEENIFED